MKKNLLLFAVLLIAKTVFTQNTIGIPIIINHTKQDYHAGSQNWDAKQDKKGIMYFANNDGLLTFDGNFWRLYQLPNKIIARSLAIDADGRIYIGSQEEFGFFAPGKNGDLQYTSLKNLIPEQDRDFSDVWHIKIFNNSIFFLSNKKIFQLSNGKIKVYKSNNKWRFLASANNELFASEYEGGLLSYKNDTWQPVVTNPTLPLQADIRTILPFGKDSLLIASFKDGLFVLHNGLLSKFLSPSINAMVNQNIAGVAFVAPERLAIITNLGGCMVVNKKGEFIQSFTKREGLQNNNILCMLLDKGNNLWLGTDNGVDMIAYNNAIKCIFPEKEDKNSGYASYIYQNNLYLGVSTGLYTAPLDNSSDLSFAKGSFTFIENTKGKVWNLSEVNGKLLMAHTNGAYIIDHAKATLLDASTGFWTFQPLYNKQPSSIMIAGTYEGIRFYNYLNNSFNNESKHVKFESSKFIGVQDSTIWIAHSYKGMYKITFNEKNEPVATAYKDTKKILSPNHNHLYKVKDKVLVTSDNGIFEYSTQQKDFIRSTYYEQLFEGKLVSFLKEDQYGNIWFCRDKKIGVVDFSTGKPTTIYIPEMNDKVTTWGNENINIVDSNNVFIAAERGFFHLNYTQYKRNKYPLEVLIRTVKSTTLNDGLLFGGYNNEAVNTKPEIKYQGNSFHFEFSSTLFAQQQNTAYSYRLKGFDKDWSAWGTKTEKDYTNIPAGKYVFEVKCRNSVDNESKISSYTFTILPPWYQTIWAYGVYGIIFCSIIYFFYKRQQQKYKRLQLIKLQEQQRLYDEEQKQLQFQHQLELEKNEKEIIRLKNENLQAEIEQKNLEEEQQRLQFQHQLELEKNEREIINLTNAKLQTDIELKNTELASSAMHLVQKGELLNRIKEELMRLKNNSEIERDSKDFKKVIKIIDSQLDTDQEWEQFAVHFDSVHTNYLKHLKERFPELTASDLKICAYLRLSLTSKEIAQLMNISIRGVETSRYRLRKKLLLPNEMNLFDFLLTV